VHVDLRDECTVVRFAADIVPNDETRRRLLGAIADAGFETSSTEGDIAVARQDLVRRVRLSLDSVSPAPVAPTLASSVGIPSEKAGEPRWVRLDVHGMTCGSCVATIERHLMKQPGVVSVQIGLLAEKADVQIDNALVRDVDIEQHINDIGFVASLIRTHVPGQLQFHMSPIDGHSDAKLIEATV